MLDLNQHFQRKTNFKSVASTNFAKQAPKERLVLGRIMGLEPTTFKATI